MALEEFTGDFRNGPVELPCHTQRPAMQRDNLEERTNVIEHHYQSLNKKEIKKKKKLRQIQVRSNRTTGIPGNHPTHLRNKYITSINKSSNTGEESGNTEITDR